MGLSQSKSPVIAASEFPLYCVRMLGTRHLLVAGGGGASKTGVANRIEIFLLELAESPEGKSPVVHCVRTATIDTNIRATMNLDVIALDTHNGEFVLACGHDNLCQLYQTKLDVAHMSNGQHLNGMLPSAGAAELKRIERKLSFLVSEGPVFQTDWHRSSSFQKVVRFDPAQGAFLATGGADGHFRLWSTSDGHRLLDQEAHKDDIDDLDISQDGAYLVSVGHDTHSFLWKIPQGSKVGEIQFSSLDISIKYRVRCFKFTKLGTRNYVFLTAVVPVQYSAKQQRSYLALWLFNPKTSLIHQFLSRPACNEIISVLALSSSHYLTGVGTLGGSVLVFDTESLQILRQIMGTHGIFVTGLDFLPPADTREPSIALGLAEECRAAVVSISADNTVQLHRIPWSESRSSFSAFLFKLLLVLAALTVLLRFLGL